MDNWRRQASETPKSSAKDNSTSNDLDLGGGDTRVIEGGQVIERGGVNYSEVKGELPEEMTLKLLGQKEKAPFYATGVSLVFHPKSPRIPTVHANFRYLEVGDKSWFGGGADMTPYKLIENDCQHFHRILKNACEKVGPDYYPGFKKECDEYFYLPHRKEARGIGGVFFDYVGRDNSQALKEGFSLVDSLSSAFSEAWFPIAESHMREDYSEREKLFQLHRRGRYVEFNLIHDRGTLFGLKTNGRVESILMSMPPETRWSYCFEESLNSEEELLYKVLKEPKNWV